MGDDRLLTESFFSPPVPADQIRTTPDSAQHRFHLLVVPRLTSLCSTALSDLGVLGSLEIQELQLGLIPLEKDVLSLEYEETYRKVELVRNPPATGCLRSPPPDHSKYRTETPRPSTTSHDAS